MERAAMLGVIGTSKTALTGIPSSVRVLDMTTTTNYADKIAKLLAKAENTTNEHEAAIYLAKASQLQLEKQISDSDLRAAQGENVPTDDLVTKIVAGLPKGAGYIKAKRDLVYGLASVFNLKVTIAADRSEVRLYGHTTDFEFVQSLFNSLILQMESAMARARGDRSFKTSFAHGYVNRVIARLREARHGQESEAVVESPGTALVLRDRSLIVTDYFNSQFGGRKLGSSYKNRSIRSTAGIIAGDAAGRNARLGQPEIRTRRELGR